LWVSEEDRASVLEDAINAHAAETLFHAIKADLDAGENASEPFAEEEELIAGEEEAPDANGEEEVVPSEDPPLPPPLAGPAASGHPAAAPAPVINSAMSLLTRLQAVRIVHGLGP
jgi:hypothetical protein